MSEETNSTVQGVKAADNSGSAAGKKAKKTKESLIGATVSAPIDAPAAKGLGSHKAARVKPTKKKRAKVPGVASGRGARRKAGRKPYPVAAFADVMPLAEGIVKHAAGQQVKRTTLLKTMGLPETAASTRNLITNSNKYGVTEGSHSAEFLKLTPKGAMATSAKVPPAERKKALFAVAIGDVEEFNLLYERCRGNPMLAPRVLHDELADLHEGDRQACVDVFTSNVKWLGMLVAREGAEYLMTVEEWMGQPVQARAADLNVSTVSSAATAGPHGDSAPVDYDKVCFIVSTIKEAGSAERTHADVVMNQYVEKSLDGTNLKAVRADKIDDQGMISRQIIDYIIHSKLVVVDLSFHNPNVFYELALRHVTGKPTVQISRGCDRLPFDVGNARTIQIDTSDGYTMVREIDTVRSQIATAIRSALANGESRDNPILAYCPTAKFTV